ncbi:MAG: ABC transporter permease [Clostridia bacterium]|nr:ABC transporter permease [Clostridia bacterium]
MFAIYRKEMRSYFINPIGYVYLGVFLVFSALLCCYTTLISGSYDTSSYFTFLIMTFIILIPILTMRLFAEERKLRTEQLLLTAPVTITGMVLGKYFAALTVFVSGVLISCINFIPLYIIGNAERAGTESNLKHIGPITGEIVGSVIAVILLGAALIAVGTLISALTENQLSAAVITIGVIAAMVLLNVFNMLTDSDGQYLIGVYAVRAVIDWVSVLSRFSAFSNGIFDYAALLYYVSLAFVFLFLTVRVYEKRRWG